MSAESLKQYLPALATVTLLGIIAINVLSSTQGQDPLTPDAKHKTICKFQVAMPYSIFTAGLTGLAAAMVASKKRPRLLGFATGFLLAELLFLILMGGLVTVVQTNADSKIVWSVTGVILFAVITVWCLMCAYPKWLRCIISYCWCCCKGQDGNKISCQQKDHCEWEISYRYCTWNCSVPRMWWRRSRSYDCSFPLPCGEPSSFGRGELLMAESSSSFQGGRQSPAPAILQ